MRYPHWRFGMEFEHLTKSHIYGLSKIYEMVINNNPAYAYLLEGNSLVDQKMVIAHVLGHVDFFKNNYFFSKTNRRMIDGMANHATRVRRHMERLGIEKVESFIDSCLCLENLIDPMSPFIARRAPSAPTSRSRPTRRRRSRASAPSPTWTSSSTRPTTSTSSGARSSASATTKKNPAEPERDVLLFLLQNAPLETWERDILEIVRDEAYYFAPQRQTKILNEGWAAYWHSKIMTERALKASEIIDYADHNAGVLATAPGQCNPYKVGIELLRHIEERWDKGRFGREWNDCQNLDERRTWDKRLGLGPQEDLRGAAALQRRHLHRRVLHRRTSASRTSSSRSRSTTAPATTRSTRASSTRSNTRSCSSSPTSATPSSSSRTPTTTTAASCCCATATRAPTCRPTTPAPPWPRWRASGAARSIC